jgi:predicted ATPase
MLTSISKLYGRDRERKLILQAYEYNLHQNLSKPSYVMIYGEEGMGKTHIIEASLGDQVRFTDGGFFVVWDFPRPCQNPIYDHIETLEDDGFDNALTSLAQQILTMENSDVQEIQDSFEQELNMTDLTLLVEMVPHFSSLLNPIIDPSSLGFLHSMNLRAPDLRRRILLQVLRIVAKPKRPIVLVMDNVNYADEKNLNLIEFLLRETKFQGILYVMTLGPSQSNGTQLFRRSLQKISQNVRSAVTINLHPLDPSITHHMAADILQSDLETIEPLHASLRHRIQGNPRYLISWLSWMHQNGYLQWNVKSQTWKWDTHHFLVHDEWKDTSCTAWNELPTTIQYFLQGMFYQELMSFQKFACSIACFSFFMYRKQDLNNISRIYPSKASKVTTV